MAARGKSPRAVRWENVVAKLVYNFGRGKADGHAGMKSLLGGKGANLAEMTRLGIPVPPGFTISTRACGLYFEGGHRLPEPPRRTG